MPHVILMVASASILFLLGTAHLFYTYFGNKLAPRDDSLRLRMGEVSPVITKQTNMWRCWVGFNASHSLGAMLFGAVYGFLAVWHTDVLFQSAYLMSLGLLVLGSFLVLARLYWFRVPFVGMFVALACYVGSIAVSLS